MWEIRPLEKDRSTRSCRCTNAFAAFRSAEKSLHKFGRWALPE